MLFGQESLPFIQLCMLPFVVALLWRVRPFGMVIPRYILLLALAISLGAFSVGYSARSLTGKRTVIARFQDDPMGAESRIFRESIERRLASFSDSRVLRVPRAFTSQQELKKRFPDARHHDVIISGRTDAIFMYFPPPRDRAERRGLKSLKDEIGFDVVLQPPVIMLTNPRDSGSIAFVADIIAAYTMRSGAEGRATAARSELLYAGAARIESRWKSRAHRALPAWLLGNEALLRAISNAEIQHAELECALKWYGYGLSLFSANDNPELAGATLNNFGVALALRGWVSGQKEDVKAARSLFQRALKTRTYPVAKGITLRAWQSARVNLNKLAQRRAVNSNSQSKKKIRTR